MSKEADELIEAHTCFIRTAVEQLLSCKLPRNLVLSGPNRGDMIAAVNRALEGFDSVHRVHFNFTLCPQATIKDVFGVSSLYQLQEAQRSTCTVVVLEDFTEMRSLSTQYIISELASYPSCFLQVFLTSKYNFGAFLKPRIRSRLRYAQLRFPQTDSYADAAYFSPAASLSAESLYILACLNNCKQATARHIKTYLERAKVSAKTIQMALTALPYLCECGCVEQSQHNYRSLVTWDEIKCLSEKFAFPSKSIFSKLENSGGV